MNITFIITKINLRGGASNTSLDLKAKAMQEWGHNVKTITLLSDSNNFPDAPAYQLIEKTSKYRNWLYNQWRAYKVLKEFEGRTDIFYFEGHQFLWGAGFYKWRKNSKPVICHFNRLPYLFFEEGLLYKAKNIPKKSLFKKIKSSFRVNFEKTIGIKLANYLDYFTADSPMVKNLYASFGLDKNKIEVLPDFMNLKFMERDKKMAELPPALPIKLIAASRIEPEKGLDVLIEAINLLKDKKSAYLTIVGEGSDLNNVKNQVKNLNLTEKIRFLPWQKEENLFQLFTESHIFIHPARWPEALGCTVIIALAAGLPVIAPEISGSAWSIKGAGLTFQNGNSEDLKNKIEKLIADTDLYLKFKNQASQIGKSFGYKKFINRLNNILKTYAKK